MCLWVYSDSQIPTNKPPQVNVMDMSTEATGSLVYANFTFFVNVPKNNMLSQ